MSPSTSGEPKTPALQPYSATNISSRPPGDPGPHGQIAHESDAGGTAYPQAAGGTAYPQAADDPDAFDATVDRSALLGGAGPPSVSAVSVLAVLCPAGHVSPPHQTTCRTCGRLVPTQEPFSTPRPTLGVLRLSRGDLVSLDRGVILGRAPSVDPAIPVASRPHVVKVASPLRDVSRNHLEVILEGWHVMVRDLGTTNGTTVTLPGRGPVQLVGHDQQVLEPGAIVALADEVTFTYDVG